MKRIVIVTGGADGIGKEISKEFLDEGYYVAAFDIKEEKIKEAIEEFGETQRFMGLVTDTTDEESVSGSVKEVFDTFGRIDVLVNNVGGSLAISQSIEYIDLKDWDKVINLNLRSTFICSKAVVPTMKEQHFGRIINMSSMAGRGRSVFGGTPYAASKAAIIGFTRQSSKDLGPHNITINAIAPGTVLSGERIKGYWEKKSDEEKQKFYDMTPVGRTGVPKDIARAAIFLSSEDASYITGAVLDINGGAWVG